jgi:tetratricopeptide (TPR) repeat protein
MTVSTSSNDNLLAFPGGLLPRKARSGDVPDASPIPVSDLSSDEGDASYEEVFERMSDRVLAGDRIASSERETAPIRYAELVCRPVNKRLELIREDPKYHSYLLAEMFIERSRESWFDDARDAQDAAEVALAIAERLDGEFYGSVLKQGLEARCWAYLANACKIGGDLGAARTAFGRADALMPTAQLDAYERAEILSIKASWLKDVLEHEEAECLLDEVTEIYREYGDDHKIGRTLILRGVIQLETGNPGRAIELFGASMTKLDDSRDPKLVSCALANLALCLNEVGRSDEALDILRTSRRRIERFGDRINLARVRWTEGNIAASQGHVEVAESAFEEARRFFLTRESDLDAALICMDMAVFYMRQNRTDKVKMLAEEMVPVFRRQGLDREVMAALILFQHAAEREIATLGLIEEIAKYLQRACQNPVPHP